jgi:ribosomal protein L11 methyltransferase
VHAITETDDDWSLPYRIDFRGQAEQALDSLVELGALDIECSPDGDVAALMPDGVTPARIARALGVDDIAVSAVVGRDDGSVWTLRPRTFQAGPLRIAPMDAEPSPRTLRLVDSSAFGTGLHPTTALCLEALADLVSRTRPDAMLDVGTGSGILALSALVLGTPRAYGVDVDEHAVQTAAANARLNALDDRLQVTLGGPDAVAGSWPLVVANVMAAPLIEMASTLVQRVGHHGHLVLSGVNGTMVPDVTHVYRRFGLHQVQILSRAGWAAAILRASW